MTEINGDLIEPAIADLTINGEYLTLYPGKKDFLVPPHDFMPNSFELICPLL